MTDTPQEIARRFQEFVDAGYGTRVNLRLDRPIDTYKATVEQDGKDVLDVHVRDGVVRKIKYIDEDEDLTRQDKFEGNGVLDSIHQKRRGEREGLQVDKKGDEWQFECRTKTLKAFKHFLIGPDLEKVSSSVQAVLELVTPELFSGLEKEKVFLEYDDGKVTVEIGKGKKSVKHSF